MNSENILLQPFNSELKQVNQGNYVTLQTRVSHLKLLEFTLKPAYDYRINPNHYHQVNYLINEEEIQQQIKSKEEIIRTYKHGTEILTSIQKQENSQINREVVQQNRLNKREIQANLKVPQQIQLSDQQILDQKCILGLSYLQKLGRKLKQAQILEDKQIVNFNQNDHSDSSNLTSTNVSPSRKSSQQTLQEQAIALDRLLDSELQKEDLQSDSINIQNQTVKDNRKKYMRKISSFEKSLCVNFVKKSSKVQTVEQLIDQANSSSQWAFDYRTQNFSTNDTNTEEYKKSLIEFQKQGLRKIAQNLNELNQQLEIQKPSQHQKSSSKINLPLRQTKALQLKVQKCELQKETHSDINKQESLTPCELVIEKPQIKYNSNQNYRKFTSNEDHEDQTSSSYFSDVLSSVSNRQIKKIHISENSMKGIYKNLRKLTQDILQSDDEEELGSQSNSLYQDSSSISAEKISPSFSIEKRYKLQKINEEFKQVDESLSSFSTNGKSPIKRVQFSLQKKQSKEIEVNYKSNDSQRFRAITEIVPPQTKLSSSTDINHEVQNQMSTYKHNIPYKHKSGMMPLHKKSNQFLQIPKQSHTAQHTTLTESFSQQYELNSSSDRSKALYNNSNNYQVSSQMMGGFDFETNDELLNDKEDLFDQIQVNQENKNSYNNNYRKFTQDDTHKQPPIITLKPTRKQVDDNLIAGQSSVIAEVTGDQLYNINSNNSIQHNYPRRRFQ